MRIFKDFVDFGISILELQLAGMQFTVFFRICAIIFSHGSISLSGIFAFRLAQSEAESTDYAHQRLMASQKLTNCCVAAIALAASTYVSTPHCSTIARLAFGAFC
ncbi:MAG: hypothetical protein SV239_10095, partial [Thermodesulfobacteriota bacterium]|nr:hypothetical protein [Thermodesulfobacteriota bacterium]